MRKNRDFQGDNFIKKRKIHKYLRRVVALLSAFVLLFTVNTLKRNANTLERIATCGYEEHVHDAGCYDAAGALVCGLEEHVHTDACYQAAPTEVEVQLGDEEEQDLPLEDDEASLEPENVFVEEKPVEEPKVFSLSEPTPVSAIVEAMKLDVDLGRVIEVGAIVDDAEHEGLLDVQPMDGGDWMVSALREFDDAELALVLEDDILIVDLENKAPAQPQETEIQAEQTEVDPEPTEDGQAIEEQTEVDTVVEEQPGEGTPVEEVEADLSEVTADAPETADVEATDENPEIIDETAETSDVEAADENPEITDETAETSDVEATDENPEITDETAETSDVEAADENPEITDETAETSDVEATDENNTETTDETAEAEPETADEPSEETSDENPETADEPSEETSDENPETADEPSEETSDENPETADEPSEEAGDEQDVDEAAQDGQAADAEPEETDEATEETSDETADAVEKQPDVSVTVDLSSVDLMDAASVEADTVKLNVADLLNAEDAAVERSGDLTVDTADFVDAATVVAADNVAVEDGVITLTAEAMEAGSVTMALESEDEDAEPQVVEIALSGYTGRVTDEIASDPAVQIVPAEGNSLPADAFAAVKSGDVPQELLDSEAAEDENIIQSAKAYDITITNANDDEISNTGAVEVTLTPSDLDVLVDVPETATVNKLDYELYHIHDDGTCEKVEDAVFDVAEDGTLNSVSFTTESFSTYVVKYTVDFTYVDAEGNERFWQFPGSGSHALREVLSELGIEGEAITDASLELTEQVDEVGENDLYLTQDLDTQEYFINSDAPFDDTYTLTVTVDEVVYTIIVTDAQGWTLEVNLYGYDGTTPLTPEALNAMSCKRFCFVPRFNTNNPTNEELSVAEFAGNSLSTQFSTNTVLSEDSTVGFEIYEAEDSQVGPWKQGDYTNNIKNKLTPISDFEIKDYTIDAASHKITLNLQQVASYTEQYGVRVYVQEPGLELDEADDYYVIVKAYQSEGSDSYYYGGSRLIIEPGQTTVDVPINEWRTQNHELVPNADVHEWTTEVLVVKAKPDKTITQIKDLLDSNNRDAIPDGYSISCYNLRYNTPSGIDSDVNDEGTIRFWYNSLTFATPTGRISKAYIDSFLRDATDFGYYTEWYRGQIGDIEATIGAAKMSAVLQSLPGQNTQEADFGYSGRNLKVNILKVLKVFTDADGKPIPDKEVTIRLKDGNGNLVKDADDNVQGEVTRRTGEDGTFEVEFTGLAPGEYTVSEVIDGHEISASGAANVGNLHVNFSATQARFLNNSNLNYFGQLAYENDSDLQQLLKKGTRVPLVVLTDTQDSVNRVQSVADAANDGRGMPDVSVYKNGTNGYKHYDIASDMERLRALSKELATATDSSTIRVLNCTASTMNANGLNLEDDGRYIVVNVKMDQKAFCPMVTLGGTVLEGDFGRGGKENSTKVLFNLLDPDGVHGYCEGGAPEEFDTTKTGAGIILAPWANAHQLEGVFGGTIISKEVNRNGNELHSDNPNQRQTLNITIQNVDGTPKVGSLELRKAFIDPSIKDKLTYFTFKVTLTNSSDPSKVQNASFPASGLKDGNTVTFNDKGEAFVQVRPYNSVTIANLPQGTEYVVEEVSTAASANYVCKGVVYADGQENTHSIVAGETAKVTVNNDLRKTGLTLKKIVEGTDSKNQNFKFDLYLWSETENETTHEITREAYTGTSSGMTFSSDNYGGHVAGVYRDITLSNGQEITLSGLPLNLHYAFVEQTSNLPTAYGYVTEEGKVEGTLDEDGAEATITNKYEAEGTLILNAHKQANEALVGKGPFTFQLTDAEGTVLSTITAEQNGTVAFDVLTFVRNKEVPEGNNKTFAVEATKTTHTFYIKEVIPTSAVAVDDENLHYSDAIRDQHNWVLNDVIYDGRILEVIVTVEDDDKGVLTATTKLPENTATFENTPVERVNIGVQKEWRNSTAKDAELYLVRYKRNADSASAPSANSSTNTPADPLVIDGGSNGSGDDNQIGGDSTGGDNGQGQGDGNEQGQGDSNEQGQTATTREVSVSITWTGSGTIASGATVTATASTDGEEAKTVTLSASNGWNGTFTGLTVGKTYNVTFTVNGDANASVQSTSITVADNDSNRVAANGTVTIPAPQLRNVPVSINWTGSGTIASSATVTATATRTDDPSDSVQATLSASNGWNGTFSGLTVGKTYNVTFTVNGDANASVPSTSITVEDSNSIAATGSVTEPEGGSGTPATLTISVDNSKAGGNWWYVNTGRIQEYNENATNDNEKFGDMIVANGSTLSNNDNITTKVLSGLQVGKKYFLLDHYANKGGNSSISREDRGISFSTESIYNNDYTIITITSTDAKLEYTLNNSSASAAPFQLAWSPFVAYAEDYTTFNPADLVADAVARSGMEAPAGYLLDTEFGRSIPMDNITQYWTVENLPVYDENGNEYYYAVVEASQLSGYDVTYAVGENGTATTTPTPVKASTLTGQTLVTLKAINTYRYVSATPKVKKYLDGQKYEGHLSDENNTAEVFNFTLTQIQPEGTYTDTAQTNTNGDVVGFDTITFTQAGTYIYEITEDKGSSDKVSYTDRAVYWKVIVENKDGKLVKTKDAYYTDAEHDTLIDQKGEEAGFYNKELTYVEVVKKWNLNTTSETLVFPEDGNPPEVKVYLHRIGPGVVGGTEDVIIDPEKGRKAKYEANEKPYVLTYNSTTKQYDTLHIGNLLKYSTNASNQNTPYIYYIVEAEGNMQGWKPSLYYANDGEGKPTASAATVTGGGTLTVVNSKSYVALPATGGVGTGVIYAAGAGLLALALAWWLARMRKRDYDA